MSHHLGYLRRNLRKGLARATLLAGCSLLCVSGLASRAHAEQTKIETVTVTAEKRVTPLQTTPVAATVLSAETLDANHISNFQEVAISVPNLTYTQFSTQESYFSIRGTLINNNGAGWDDAVTTFIDGVPTTGLGDQDPDLFDLSSIEVLRGPQGTLFGRNVTGGAIVIHTLEPSFDFNGKAQVTYGAFNTTQARGFVTGPITDDVSAKLSLDYNYKSDYIPNTAIGGKTAGTNQLNGRTQVLWRPRNDLEVLFGGDFLYDNSGGYPTKLIGNGQSSNPNLANLSYSPERTNQGFNGFNHRDIFGGMARATWTTPEGVLSSIAGYRNVDEKFPNSVIGDPENQLLAVGIVQDKQFTEELNYASPTDGPFTWVGGAFYIHANKREANPLFFNVDPNTQIGLLFSPLSGIQNPQEAFDQTADQHIRTDSYAIYGEAAYAFWQNFKLTVGARETWERKSGRSVVDFTNKAPCAVPPPPAPPTTFEPCTDSMFPGFATYHRSWNAFTPKVTLTWTPESNLLLYATVSRGFKGGGYDLSGESAAISTEAADAGLAIPFQPETVTNYEVGEKWTGFDDRVVVDGNLFLDAYQKLQTNQLILVNGNFQSQTSNAPGVSIVQGVELEATGLPTDWLTLGLTYAYMDAHFDQNPNLNPPNDPSNPSTADIHHGRIPYAPRNQVHLSGEVRLPCPEFDGTFAFGADYTFHSKVFFNNLNDQPGFIQHRSIWNDIINAHFEYTSDDALWRVSLFGKNLTDDRSLLHAADVSFFFQNVDLAQPNFTDDGGLSVLLAKYYPERTWGISVTRNF